jgi:thioredoxin-related protein
MMKIKLSKIITLALAALVSGISAVQGAQTDILKKESIPDLEKKVLYSKPRPATNNWYDFKRGMFIAAQEKKYVVVSFCTKSSSYCLKLEENTFGDPAVKRLLRDKFVAVKVDADSTNPMLIDNKKVTEKDLIKQNSVTGFPTITFLDSGGKKVSGAIKGYVPPEMFLTLLKFISSESYKNTTFKDFMQKEKGNMAK